MDESEPELHTETSHKKHDGGGVPIKKLEELSKILAAFGRLAAGLNRKYGSPEEQHDASPQPPHPVAPPPHGGKKTHWHSH